MARSLRYGMHRPGTRVPREHRRPNTYQDVVDTMPQPRSQIAPATRRMRPAGPHCRGGASSLLRLANPASPRLPKAPALSDWVQRAASVLGLGAEPRPACMSSEFR